MSLVFIRCTFESRKNRRTKSSKNQWANFFLPNSLWKCSVNKTKINSIFCWLFLSFCSCIIYFSLISGQNQEPTEKFVVFLLKLEHFIWISLNQKDCRLVGLLVVVGFCWWKASCTPFAKRVQCFVPRNLWKRRKQSFPSHAAFTNNSSVKICIQDCFKYFFHLHEHLNFNNFHQMSSYFPALSLVFLSSKKQTRTVELSTSQICAIDSDELQRVVEYDTYTWRKLRDEVIVKIILRSALRKFIICCVLSMAKVMAKFWFPTSSYDWTQFLLGVSKQIRRIKPFSKPFHSKISENFQK